MTSDMGTGDSAQTASPNNDERDSESLAARLAYEHGMRNCELSLNTLAERRTLIAMILSLPLPAAGVIASLSVLDEKKFDIEPLAIAGWVLLGISTLVALIAGSRVLIPINTTAAMGANKIIENYIISTPTSNKSVWVYKYLARDYDRAYGEMEKELNSRSSAYQTVIFFIVGAFVGTGIVVLDALL